METESSIVIQAPLERIFAVTSDLERWPAVLPHYRHVRFLERREDGGVISMAAMRGILPISWVSDLRVDPVAREVHFFHLKKWTKGMKVVWTYTPQEDGVLVKITHDLRFRVPALAWLFEPIIGNFIHAVAGRTLATFKQFLERPPAGAR
jgi:ribosome-associated toxin RatA of RatAB toxin-antitoxin module